MFSLHICLLISSTFTFGFCFDATCDSDNPCPSGFVCRYITYLPGTKACVYKGLLGNVKPSKRSGRCPTTDMQQRVNLGSTLCNSNEDCHSSRKCCPLSFGKTAFCVEPIPVTAEPMVTPIIVGSAKLGATLDYIGSATLIQSKGYNILVDTSSFRMTKSLLQNLWQKAGLTPEDIDLLVNTHGHPDHFGSSQTFSDLSQVVGRLVFNGHIFTPTPLAKNQRYFLNDDNNVEVISTPGHTPQCSVFKRDHSQRAISRNRGDRW